MSSRLAAIFSLFAAAPLVLAALFFLAAVELEWVYMAPSFPIPLAAFALAMLAGGVCAGAGLWWFLSQHVTQPIRELSLSVEQLAGQESEPDAVMREADLGLAAERLTRLVERIQTEQVDLKDTIAARSEALTRALAELQLLKDLQTAIIQNIPSGLAVLDRRGRLLYFNESFQRAWGVPFGSLGLALREIGRNTPLAAIDWRRELDRMARDGELRDAVVEAGEWPSRRVVRYSLFRLSDEELVSSIAAIGQGFCIGFANQRGCGDGPADPARCAGCYAFSDSWEGPLALLLIDDVTEQCQLEAQLIQSEKLAGLGQLSAGVAHEMRNPLSSIYNAAFYISDVLTDEEPDLADLQAYVELIQRNVDRAQRTVTNILNFARPSGPETVRADLANLVEQTLSILDKAMVDQGVELHRRLTPDQLVQCRPETVKQALLNLIVNALQAMPEGGHLEVRVDPADHGRVLMSVKDTGTGISAEHLGHIFNPFFTTKPPGEGTGLGLSIARRAIEADGGRLEVESQMGEGTTFHVYLPAADPLPMRRDSAETATEAVNGAGVPQDSAAEAGRRVAG